MNRHLDGHLPIAAGVLITTAAVWMLDPLSVPSLLLGMVLGMVVGVVMMPGELPPVELPTPEGPVAGWRRRRPWTEPGWVT